MSASNPSDTGPGLGFWPGVRYSLCTKRGQIIFLLWLELLIILFLGSFSQPIREILGFSIIPIELEETERAGRIIMLYHSLAVPFLSAVALYVLELYPVREAFKSKAQWSLFPGSILTAVGGISFAYLFRGSWVLHGFFIVGMALVFYGGMMMLIGIWPSRDFPKKEDVNPTFTDEFNWEQLNLVLVTVAILISSFIGGVVASYFGNGFEAYLAETTVRNEHHDVFERSVVAHLHVMVALLDAAVMLIVFRYLKMKGIWYKIAMMLTMPGIVIMSSGAWLVITGWEDAHTVITVGSGFLLSAAGILTVGGWLQTSKDVLGDSFENSSTGQRIVAVFKDPVKFGLYWLFMFVNFVVTIPGIYVAINLETYRLSNHYDIEYAFNVGHWHVLATLTAIIVVLLTMDYSGLEGKLRIILGWLLTAGSTIGFAFTTVYMLQPPEMPWDWAFYLIDVGVMLFFAGIGIYGLQQLKEIFTKPKEE